MSQDFDWSSESVVVQPVEAIAVYTNPRGEIVIRQRSLVGSEDPFIVIPISHVQSVVDAMLEQAARQIDTA